VSALALSIARLRQRGTKRRVRRDGLAEAEKNKHARNTATRPRRYLEPDRTLVRSSSTPAESHPPAQSLSVCILFFSLVRWLRGSSASLSLSSVAQARGWTGCTSVIDNPSDTLSKHQPRGGLETSFQKSKITRGAVTPSADLHTRAHCRQGPEAYSATSPAARTAQYWPSRGEAQRKGSYSEATGNGGVRPGWFYPEPHVRLQPLTDAAGRRAAHVCAMPSGAASRRNALTASLLRSVQKAMAGLQHVYWNR
jgi:hypothetical protein